MPPSAACRCHDEAAVALAAAVAALGDLQADGVRALVLAGQYDEAARLLERAAAIAETGPYPERQIAAHSLLAVLGDEQGDTARTIVNCRVGGTVHK
ncbi:MAG: hypothetical protein M3460_04155 [Actinomycetota bacterium]|nr:hypothetical protein [Actinomycetota bacterium]